MKEKPVIIIGASGLGRTAAEIFEQHSVLVYCYLDENKELHNTEIDNIIVMGGADNDEYLKLIGKECGVFVAIEHQKTRMEAIRLLERERKVIPVNAIHPTAIIASSVQIGDGNLINSLAAVNSGTMIPNNCVIHSNVTIEQNVLLGNDVQIGAGAVINSKCEIGKGVVIGAGAVIAPNVKIGDNAQIGFGAIVLKDVPKGKTVFGNPAQEV